MRPKALLLNPPSDVPVMRDYYCTSVSKAGYAWHPAEFLFQSAVLSKRFDVTIIDAVAENLSPVRVLERIGRERYDLLLGLVGAASPDADAEFLSRVPAAKKIASGEPVLSDPSDWLSTHPRFDAALSDFSTGDLPAFFDGVSEAHGLAIRTKSGISDPKPTAGKEIRVGVPRHELFAWNAYRMPLQRYRPFASFLTDCGCPFSCSFCNSGTLRYRVRAVEELDAELAAVEKMGFKEIFLKDMSFGALPRHADDVLDLLGRRKFSWHSYMRVQDAAAERLARMAACGCHLIQVGLEHVTEKILAEAGKKHAPDDIRKMLAAAQHFGIDVGLHVVLGLPGETKETLSELTRFLAATRDVAYLSVNLYAPRTGSRLERLSGGGDLPHDSTRGSTAGELPVETLTEARNRMYRRFYLRMGRMKRLVTKMRASDIFRALRGIFLT